MLCSTHVDFKHTHVDTDLLPLTARRPTAVGACGRDVTEPPSRPCASSLATSSRRWVACSWSGSQVARRLPETTRRWPVRCAARLVFLGAQLREDTDESHNSGRTLTGLVSHAASVPKEVHSCSRTPWEPIPRSPRRSGCICSRFPQSVRCLCDGKVRPRHW